jgi:MFS family permease
MLGALASRDFRVFLASLTIYDICLWTYRFGQGWLVIQLAITDGSPELAPLYLGYLGLAVAVPGLVVSLVAGAVTDRFELRRVLLVTQLCGVALALALAWLAASGLITIWTTVALITASAVVAIFENTARNALLMRVVPRHTVASALGLDSVTFNITQAIGPLLGGVLLAVAGLPVVLLANAVGFLALTGMVIFIHLPARSDTRDAAPMLASVVEGLRYVRDDAVLRWVIVLGVLFSFFARPYASLLPAFSENVLSGGATGLSTLMSTIGVGALAGSVAMSVLGSIRRTGILFIGSIAATGAAMAIFALQRDLTAALPAAFVLGATSLLGNGLQNAILQMRSDERMLGRVISVSVLVFFGVIPLGQLALGALGSVFGIETSLFLGGVVTLVGGLYGLSRAAPVRTLAAETAVGTAGPSTR